MHCQTIGHIGSIQKVEFFFQMVSIVLLGSVLEATSDMAWSTLHVMQGVVKLNNHTMYWTSVQDGIIPLSLWITGHPPQEDRATKEWGEGSRIDGHLEEEPGGDWHLFPQRQEVYRWGTDFNCRPWVPGWDHAVLDSRAGYLQGAAKHWALDGGLPEGAGTTLWQAVPIHIRHAQGRNFCHHAGPLSLPIITWRGPT